ncbi:MAG: hypothetical protein JSR09_02170 [Bacteroidetes bacterium]|nr:hypothetical protein [Bacteroidota bacterium]MBS1648489.1 hypothetical protein [Bacteroidota bacterium]
MAKKTVPAPEKKVKATTTKKKVAVASSVEKVIVHPSEKIRNACVKAFETFQKINEPAYNELQSKLAYVIGSYDFDKNPIGLYEFGAIALPILKKIKEEDTKKVTKQLITELEKALKP